MLVAHSSNVCDSALNESAERPHESNAPIGWLGQRLLTPCQSHLDQPPDRFGAGGFGVGLAVDPGGDRRLQFGRHADGACRVDAGPGPAARSFLFDGY